MGIQFKTSSFKELSVEELYQILQLRSEVFVVEQNCVYQDIDGKDKKAIHIIGEFEDKIVAYTRIFKAGDYFENASIGRVVVDTDYRNRKWGHDLIRESILAVQSHFSESPITISAQLYLQKFYESHGFVVVGETYLEDGIPHIEMSRA
ncbi:MAG: GNAT family N-acetyltransferase [Flavobacterium sp.]|nr:MAG: GNAT family N-acetyltransferase [Flavobacterium sp.]